MQKKPKIGALRHHIEVFEDEKQGDDGGGVAQSTPKQVLKTWGKIESIRGREFFSAHQTTAELSHRITIRHTDCINVIYQNRRFDIQYIFDKIGSGAFLELMTLEKV